MLLFYPAVKKGAPQKGVEREMFRLLPKFVAQEQKVKCLVVQRVLISWFFIIVFKQILHAIKIFRNFIYITIGFTSRGVQKKAFGVNFLTKGTAGILNISKLY